MNKREREPEREIFKINRKKYYFSKNIREKIKEKHLESKIGEITEKQTKNGSE